MLTRAFVSCAVFALLGGAAVITSEPAEARRGCCSHHGGVCGCSCCDGSSLSAKCAPYYPECNASTSSQATGAFATPKPVRPRPTAKPVPKRGKGSSFYCQVVGVHDGDTLTCLESKVQYKIRLGGVDAPELAQAHGQDAKKFTSDMIFSKQVRIIVTDVDRYQRLVADVVVSDKRVNYELVRAGWAWHYGQYSKDPNLAVLEKQARIAKIGLWADMNPTAPWDWRKAH
jgi:endonuclease YncB( thermonuclease family)